MHICIPDTREVKPQHGGAYLLYNVHIDGLYHCSLRFKQLLHLHQALSKRFTGPYHRMPTFPSKKLLPLSSNQVEERRTQLEKYLQNISQDKAISNSSIFNLFLLEAQRESTRIRENQVHLDIELVNGQKIRLQIVTHDSADAILTSVCRALGLNDRYHAYFCLCLCGYDVVRDKLIIKRRLSFFEAPFITLQMAIQQQEQLQSVLSTASTTNCNISNNGSSYSSSENSTNSNCQCLSCSAQQQQQHLPSNLTSVPPIGSLSGSTSGHYNRHHYHHHRQNGVNTNGNSCYYLQSSSSSGSSSRPFVTHRILLRKSYWDPIYDSYLLNDQQALNLLFIQTVYDIKHSLMFVDRETYHQLESLLASDAKLEYILLARTLKYYNYVHFEPCYSDYPRPRTKVMISIGSKELNMRVLKSAQQAPPARASQQCSTSSSGSSPANELDDECRATTRTAPNPSEPILYCTSSLVPTGYQHLITKDDIIEEEYNFKVPLIRCWRLTSLETLNCNDHNNNHINSGRANHGRPPISSAATTTLAGGKRRSLSLFNSVVGSNNSPSSSAAAAAASNHSPANHTINGSDGTSLLTALSGNSFFRCNGNNYNDPIGNNVPNNNNHLYCQHENQRCEPMRQHQADHAQFCQYELSFEYLVSKDTLKWITISSDQAIFISISLQGVVDELVSKRDIDCSLYDKTLAAAAATTADNTSLIMSQQNSSSNQRTHLIPPLTASTLTRLTANSETTNRTIEKFTYLSRDGLQKQLSASNQQLIDKFGTTLGYSPISPYTLAATRRHRQQQQQASRNNSATSALSFIGASVNTSAASRMFAPVAGSFWSSSERTTLAGAQHQQLLVGVEQQPTCCSFEISNLKKAPSPIINDAFEGTTNDDDL